MSLSLGYTTASNKTEAKSIVLSLLEEKLIACANILEATESYFFWDDGIQHTKEVLIFFKTRSRNQNKIIKLIKSIHSYQCPCIVFSPIENGNTDFIRWVEDAC